MISFSNINNKIKKENNSGITLIALVVTIIVLLILAAITITIALGNGGLIEKVGQGRDNNVIGQEKEALNMAYSAYMINHSVNNTGNITDEIKMELRNLGYETEVEGNDNEIIVTFIKTGHSYTLSPQTGDIEKEIDSIIDITDEFILTKSGTLSTYSLYDTNGQIEEYDSTKANEKEKDTNVKKILEDRFLYKDKYYLTNNNTLKFNNLYIEDVKEYYFYGSSNDELEGAALANNGDLYVWGENKIASLNIPSIASEKMVCVNKIQNSVLYGKKIIKASIDTWTSNGYALDDDGNYYIWGNAYSGWQEKIGNGTNDTSTAPICLTSQSENPLFGKKIIDAENNWVLDEDGKVYMWGYVRAGDGTYGTQIWPLCLNSISSSALNGKKIKKFVTNSYTYFVLDEENHIYVWGSNDCGDLANGTTSQNLTITCINNDTSSPLYGKEIKDIGNDENGYCYAIDNDGKLYTWGDTISGQLGNGTPVNTRKRSKPICISDLEGSALRNKRVVKTGRNWAIDSDGKMYAWGINNDPGNSIGDGTSNSHELPICISDINDSILKGKKIIDANISLNTPYCMDDKKDIYTWNLNIMPHLLTQHIIINEYERAVVSDVERIAGSKVINVFHSSQDPLSAFFYLTENGKIYYKASSNDGMG